MTKKKRRYLSLIFAALLILSAAVFLLCRALAQVPDYAGLSLPDEELTDADSVIRAAALSYFVYGCESVGAVEGLVSDMLDRGGMGILDENFGVVRGDPDDPQTARFDTSALIRRAVGDFRCLCCLKNAKNGFFGAAFCDDASRRIWVVYAGAVSFADYLACAQLVASPGFSAQEKAAFTLFDTVLQSDEVKNESYGVCLCGHSLGGALATEVSLASGCPAVTVNGADRLAYGKIAHIAGKKPPCRVHNYVTQPDGFSPMETIQRLTFLGPKDGITTHLFEKSGHTADTHNAFSFLRFADEGFTLPCLPEEIK